MDSELKNSILSNEWVLEIRYQAKCNTVKIKMKIINGHALLTMFKALASNEQPILPKNILMSGRQVKKAAFFIILV